MWIGIFVILTLFSKYISLLASLPNEWTSTNNVNAVCVGCCLCRRCPTQYSHLNRSSAGWESEKDNSWQNQMYFFIVPCIWQKVSTRLIFNLANISLPLGKWNECESEIGLCEWCCCFEVVVFFVGACLLCSTYDSVERIGLVERQHIFRNVCKMHSKMYSIRRHHRQQHSNKKKTITLYNHLQGEKNYFRIQ